MLITSTTVVAQQQGVGLRLGDPMGVTYKKYQGRSRAVEFTLGSASARWHNSYYIDSFAERPRYNPYRYQNHTVKSTVYLQGRYLFHTHLPLHNLQGTLTWYGGAGVLLKVSRVQYRFQSRETPFATQREVVRDIDIGPEGILGLEYTFQDTPLSVFGELSLLLEVADRPATLRGFGGMGVRYNFLK